MLVNGITDPLSPHVTDASGLALLRGHAFVAHALAINPNLVVWCSVHPIIDYTQAKSINVVEELQPCSSIATNTCHCPDHIHNDSASAMCTRQWHSIATVISVQKKTRGN